MKSPAHALYEIGDLEYEVGIAHFHPGSPATRDYPGDGPEVDAARLVAIYRDGKRCGECLLGEFLPLLAADRGITASAAETTIEEDLIEAAMDDLDYSDY